VQNFKIINVGELNRDVFEIFLFSKQLKLAKSIYISVRIQFCGASFNNPSKFCTPKVITDEFQKKTQAIQKCWRFYCANQYTANTSI